MRPVLTLVAACLIGVVSAPWAWGHDDWDREPSRSRSSFSMSVYSFTGGGHHDYGYYRGYSYYYGHRHPPVVVKPFPGHPPVVIQPIPPRHDCDRYRHYDYRYRSSGGAIGIYGPRFGFTLRW